MEENSPTSTLRQAKEDELAASLEKLSAALETDSLRDADERWATGVLAVLASVEQALQKRAADAASLKGPLASIDKTRPSLVRQAAGLSRDYTKLLDECCLLRETVRNSVRETARASMAAFVAKLREDKETETKLVLDSVNTDIGAGD